MEAPINITGYHQVIAYTYQWLGDCELFATWLNSMDRTDQEFVWSNNNNNPNMSFTGENGKEVKVNVTDWIVKIPDGNFYRATAEMMGEPDKKDGEAE